MDRSGHPGGQAAPEGEDPFARATGRVGAAPAPSWGQKGAEPPRPETPAPGHHPEARAGSVYSEPSYGVGTRSYRRSGTRHRRRRFRPALSVPHAPVVLLILGLGTAGLGWLLAAVGYWIRLFGGRGANRDRAEVARLRRWALVFTVLGALAVIFWVALDSTSRKEMLPPSVSLTRSLGQAATLTEPVAPRGGAAEVPVTVTFSDFSYPLPEKAGADTATGLLKVCATTKAVDPMGVVFSLAAQVGGNVVNADFFTAFQTTSLRNPLRPGHCASGVVGFPVPTGRSVQAVRYGVNGRVTWTVPERSATGEPTTT